jgi:Type IV secretion-system coupling protein DNA-binding domain
VEVLQGLVALLVVLSPIAWWFVAWQRKRHREHEEIVRRVDAHAAEEGRVDEAQDATDLWLEIQESFPFVPTPKVPDLSGESIREAILRTLTSYPSLGTFGSLPAPILPAAARRRHLYVCGKTGAGKTTYLEHLVVSDLCFGRGVAVLGPEGDLFRRLLSFLPPGREKDLVYFAPGSAESPLSFNPLAVEEGDDQAKAAEDLFTIFKRSLADDLGPRMEPILQNAFAALTGREGATFWDVRRIVLDPLFRREVTENSDPYVRSFWRETYPRFPEGAALPILSRLDQFLRPPTIRRTICRSRSSFSFREIIREKRVLFVDLSGLSEENRLLLGQMVLSKFALELIRRERAGRDDEDFFLHCDEFQSFAGVSEALWRELLSRGRKYGLALVLANQYPGQLPPSLQAEIFGNVNSLVAFALGRKDADAVRKELLVKREKKGEVKVEPVEAEEISELPVGKAIAKLAGGRAVRLTMPPPLRLNEKRAERAMRESWERYRSAEADSGPDAGEPATVKEPESFLE